MITISTTSAPEARAAIDLFRHTPASLAFRVFLAGREVASRSPSETRVAVTDTNSWPQADQPAQEHGG